MERSTATLDRKPAAAPTNSQGAAAFGIAVGIVVVYFLFLRNPGPTPEEIKQQEELRESQRQTELLQAEVRRRAHASQPKLSSATYSSLRVGKTGYYDACEILNSPGREVSKSGGYTTYVWDHGGKIITATFNDRDMLVSRSQSGVP